MKNLSLNYVERWISRSHLLNQMIERVAMLILPKASARAVVCLNYFCGYQDTGQSCQTQCYRNGPGDCLWIWRHKWAYKFADNPGCYGMETCYTQCEGIWYTGGPCTPCPT